MTTYDPRTLTDILDTDARRAADAADAAVIAQALELAPLSWSDARSLPAVGIGPALAGCDDVTIRLQAIRFLAERRKPWGWGDVDTLEAWLRRQIAAAVATRH